ncbi:DUF916 and DUF3324 domain-containing protein [Levilactobacillus cerevisiae]|uniref:DUF916 and DUF3324 domain-containing protein n=1 Tax=Levilactobacillus cerevisiae TaxID=1704076 RepID=UPI000F781DC8|nr:DUF916 and DUF3324 domain-containing protein [Levilactobacillus cerevisiae]
MKFKWKMGWLVACVLLAGVLGGSGAMASAAQLPKNFAATPLLPKNQLSKKAGYFDLKVTPGTTQTLRLSVTNPSNKRRTLQVIPVNATTSDSGNAVYIPSNRTDPSAQTTFTKMTSGSVSVSLAPRQGKTVTFRTVIPTTGFSGEVLGGLFVTDPTATGDREPGSDFRLNNRYAEVTAVALQCRTGQTFRTDLKFGGVGVKQPDTLPVAFGKIRNLTPALFGDLQINARVMQNSTGKQIATKSLKNGSMAPNSWFNYSIPLGRKKLTAGKYTLKLDVTSGKRVWNFSGTFTLTRSQTAEHNSLIKSDKQPNYWWLWLLLFLLLAILLALAAYWLGTRRNRDDDEDEDEIDDNANDETDDHHDQNNDV